MTFGTARDLSSQVVAIPMTSFGMLMKLAAHRVAEDVSPKTPFTPTIPAGRERAHNRQ
jgi:hypothetical protein